jgi:hypothetical protein
MPDIRIDRLPILALTAALVLIGCGGGDGAPQVRFTSAAPINGEQPDRAVNVIFGQAVFDANEDQVNDGRALMLIGSNNPNLCSFISSASLREFLLDLVDGRNSGIASEVVALTVVDRTTAAPFAQGTIQGNGSTIFVHAGFVVLNGSTVVANTLTDTSANLGGDGSGTLTLNAFRPDALEPTPTATGSYQGTQRNESSTGTNVAINTGLTGTFAAEPCQGMSNGLLLALSSLLP